MKKSVRRHLIDRHVDLNLHKPIINEDERVAYFLLHNLSGQIVGYQQYKPDRSKIKSNDPRDGKYFTRPSKDKICIFGVESLNRSGPLFLTEGIFDACRLTNLGYAAIASLSNNPVKMKSFLWSLNRFTVAICDGDEAGKKLAKYGTVSYIMDEGKDLGDCTDEEVSQILDECKKLWKGPKNE